MCCVSGFVGIRGPSLRFPFILLPFQAIAIQASVVAFGLPSPTLDPDFFPTLGPKDAFPLRSSSSLRFFFCSDLLSVGRWVGGRSAGFLSVMQDLAVELVV